MKTTYLKDFKKYSSKKVAFIPLGTIEWHGNHLPIETDFIVAQKICELLSKKSGGYVMPPIYLGTDKEVRKNRKILRGMDRHLGKQLSGSLYYLKPGLFKLLIKSLFDNLENQGFGKIYLVAGHTGSKQVEVLEKIEKENKRVVFLNPFENINYHVGHADEYETSLLWACRPEEERISRKVKIGLDDDFFQFKGYDPRKKSSLQLGNKLLREIIGNLEKNVNKKSA